MFETLARVESSRMWLDPFAELSIEAFAKLESDDGEAFLDRLERMWGNLELGAR